MTARSLFIAGTDTGIGKTTFACELLRQMRQRGLRVCGYKPVASGCVRTAQGLRNDDALALQEAAGTHEPYELINPYAFEPPIAPHLAARAVGESIRVARLNEAHAQLAARYDWVIVEGAGGWLTPLNEQQTFADWAAAQNWPVVLVVGMRLGCINHALLSVESITRRCELRGWIANALSPPMNALAENIELLDTRIAAPRLGTLMPPASAQLNLEALLGP